MGGGGGKYGVIVSWVKRINLCQCGLFPLNGFPNLMIHSSHITSRRKQERETIREEEEEGGGEEESLNFIVFILSRNDQINFFPPSVKHGINFFPQSHITSPL